MLTLCFAAFTRRGHRDLTRSVIFVALTVMALAGVAQAVRVQADQEPVQTGLAVSEHAMVGLVTATDGRTFLISAGGIDGSGDPIDSVQATPIDGEGNLTLRAELPEALADSAVVTAGSKMWCIGGEGAAGPTDAVYRLEIESSGYVDGQGSYRLRVEPGPALPEPVTGASGVMMDAVIHLVGGTRPGAGAEQALRILTLDPAKIDAGEGWKVAATTRAYANRLRPSVVVRFDDRAQRSVLHILGGDGEKQSPHLMWQPGEAARAGWHELSSPADGAEVIDAAGYGAAHILVATDSGLRFYHTFTDTWVPAGGRAERVAAAGEQVYRLNRSDGQWVVAPVEVVASERDFGWVNYAVIVIYLGALMWIGGFFAGKENTTEDYFLGGRKIPWWAAGISIYATGVSAISFMAIPAKTYATDWTYISQGILPPIVTFIAAYLFVPMLRRLNITTVMEYKEMRFHQSLRYLATFILVAAQIGGRMSIVLLLPAIALSAVTGIDPFTAVLLMGVMATIYTVLGGISAVIWTDVLQIVVMFGGALLSLGLILFAAEAGPMDAIVTANEFGKFRSFDWTWDFTTATVWIFTIWGISDLFNRVGQESMQRAFSTKGVVEARRSLITCALISVPGTLIFYALGSALFAHYQRNPAELDPTLANDAIFPLFIATNLPVGLAGLVIAGLFAASMSTLDSGMNTVATVLVTDYYRLFQKQTSQRVRVLAARGVTVFAGVAGTGMALILLALDQRSLWDTFTIVMGLIGGGFGGVMVLGMMTRRANTVGTWVGVLAGTGAVAFVKFQTDVSFFIYGAIGLGVCVLVGYVVSIMSGGEEKDLTGLTIWTPRREFVETQEEPVEQ